MEDRIFHKRLQEESDNRFIHYLFGYICLNHYLSHETVLNDPCVFFYIGHLVPDGHYVASLNRITEDIRKRHGHLGYAVFVLDKRHIPHAGKCIIQEMRIDLIAVCKYLHFLLGKFSLIQTDLAVLYLFDHSLVFVQHVVKTGCNLSDLISSAHLQTSVGMLYGIIYKSVQFMNRPCQLKIGIENDDGKKH